MNHTALRIDTDGTHRMVAIGSDDCLPRELGCDYVDCVVFTLTTTAESIDVWVDDEGAFNQEANVLGTIALKEVCGTSATEYFAYQHVLYGPLLITGSGEELSSISEVTARAIASKLETYLNANL